MGVGDPLFEGAKVGFDPFPGTGEPAVVEARLPIETIVGLTLRRPPDIFSETFLLKKLNRLTLM